MKNQQRAVWVLRIAVAGEFLGHGALALQGKQQWVGWITQILKTTDVAAAQILFFIGLLDLLVAAIVLLKPVKPVLIWAAFWGFWTALLRPLIGEPIWDFIERFTNWGGPLALLLLLMTTPKKDP